MSNSGRPLSPHLSVYRWPITMTLSILHRITGVGLSVGLIVFAAWLIQAAAGPEQYQYFRVAMSHPIGIALLIAWTFAFFLHLGNGIRHLVWDVGYGFEKSQANASAYIVLVMAIVLTALFWVLKL
ncbi:MAG: succinate dehydrogenase, cytochrome b556 subunit [Gammaproteobacteria bacterium]|nr:succinate dehydrogenase, cytochrome b556 subunit [Gammaproteobacteria bacterium]